METTTAKDVEWQECDFQVIREALWWTYEKDKGIREYLRKYCSRERKKRCIDPAAGSCLAGLRMRQLVNGAQVCLWQCVSRKTNIAYVLIWKLQDPSSFNGPWSVHDYLHWIETDSQVSPPRPSSADNSRSKLGNSSEQRFQRNLLHIWVALSDINSSSQEKNKDINWMSLQ